MQSIFFVAALFVGTIVGSFINALLFRFNTGKSVLKGRSRCMHCRHQLGALDLIPIFSFIFLRGRCRYCSARISPQYPLVEVVAAALSVLVYMSHPEFFGYFFWLIVTMTLLCIVVYDIRHTIIPFSFSIFLALLALISLFVSFGDVIEFAVPTIWGVLSGPILALPLFLLSLVSKGRWMGWADSGLEISLGWLLGLSMGATALMLAFWSGAVVGVLLLFVSHRWKRKASGLTMKSEIPFAPFLVFGALVALFFHVDFFQTVAVLWQ